LNNSGKIGIQEAVAGGIFVRKTANKFNVSPSTVSRIKKQVA
jgi:hypothetical protein